MLAAFTEAEARTNDQVGNRAGGPDRPGLGKRSDPRRDVHRKSRHVAAADLDFAGVHAAANVDAELSGRVTEIPNVSSKNS